MVIDRPSLGCPSSAAGGVAIGPVRARPATEVVPRGVGEVGGFSACAYACRMVKVTSLAEQAYRELKKNEEEGESLSDVVLKMAGRK